MTGINEYGVPKSMTSFSYLLMFLFCCINYQQSIRRTFINCALTVGIVGIIQLIIYFLLLVIVPDSKNIHNYFHELIVNFIMAVITITLLPKIKIKQISDFFMKNNKILILLGTFLMILLGSSILQMHRTGFLSGENSFLFIYFILLLVLLVIEWQKSHDAAEKRKAQLEMNGMYFSAYKKLIQSIREKQHDFKNHINALSGMAYTIQDYKQLVERQREYCAGVLKETENTSLVTLIENPLLAGFLITEIQEMKERGIEVEHHCIFSCDETKFPEYMLVEIMGILIDNAIEAVSQYEEKRIKIELTREDNLFNFSVINLCSEETLKNISKFFDRGYSTKGINRGIGLSKLKRIVDESNGEITIGREELGEKIAIRIGVHIPI